MNHLNLDRNTFLREVSERKKRYIIDGKNFPLPRKYHDKIFYDYSESIKVGKKDRLRSDLYSETLAFERAEYLAAFVAQLRKRAQAKLDTIDYLAVCAILEDEKFALEDRASAAKEYYYSAIKKEKI